MVLDKLGDSLQGAIKKIAGAGRVDKRAVDEMVKDIQRALLQSDVNVKQVMELSTRIRERALALKPRAGVSAREHVIRIVYDELVNLIGESTPLALSEQTIMMIGLQGSGKTTTTAKLARYFQRKGLKPAVICADTDRPGAYDQLQTLCDRLNIAFYGERTDDPIGIVKRGIDRFKAYDVKIIDTAGRHSLEHDLIEQMERINTIAKPDQKLLVLDGAIGQQARDQARTFHDSVGVTGVIITKLDGTAKGGGALSAVSETKAPIAFIGVGENIEDLEKFETDRFISKLLGMGDIKTLIERAEESFTEEIDVEKMVHGKFTLKDMYQQLEAMNKMGPLKQVMQMLPIGGMKIPDDMYDETSGKMTRYKVIMDSMTEAELLDPKIVDSSRVRRIARGSGTGIEDVRELLKYHRMMQKAMKGLRGGRFNVQKMMKKLGM
ncbi:MAG: signal recognition particle protein Srp54 [Euryarchaeota archaeon]|nr:signal recognition particle protein Srp54 [Euryarchaeota archaeon]